jgi:hypothetical protein
MAYTIKAVTGNKPWAGQHGPMMSYYLTLVDGEGQETANVDLAQKPTSPAPQPGQTLEGNIDQGSYGPKFKKAFTQSFGGGGRGKSPEEQASIVRQHSQEMALRALEIAATFGVVDPPQSTRDFFVLVEKTTEWFVKDARKVVA